jgi:hypothetical protein
LIKQGTKKKHGGKKDYITDWRKRYFQNGALLGVLNRSKGPITFRVVISASWNPSKLPT